MNLQKNKVLNLTMLSMFIALTAIMIFTPLGTISIGIVSITIAHIPTLVAVLLFGLPFGLSVSLSFGIMSLVKAYMQPAPFDIFFQNPLVSILPRLMIPITCYFTYKLLQKMKPIEKLSITISAIVGNLANTICVFFMLYLLYAKEIELLSNDSFFNVLLAIIASNVIYETIFVALITTPVMLIAKNYFIYNTSRQKKA